MNSQERLLANRYHIISNVLPWPFLPLYGRFHHEGTDDHLGVAVFMGMLENEGGSGRYPGLRLIDATSEEHLHSFGLGPNEASNLAAAALQCFEERRRQAA